MTRLQLPTVFDRTLLDEAKLGSLFDHSIGMDHWFNRIFDDFLPAASSVKYPPYNIRMDDDHTRTIEMALAGYGESDIDVLVEDGTLVVRGNKVANIDDTSVNYVYKGLAARKFERRFALAEGAEVTEATLKNGMLNITVATTPPEVVEPRRIPLNVETPTDVES